MRLPWIAAAAVLCALPARGDPPQLAPQVLDALTQLDELPSQTSLTDVLGLLPDQAVVPLAQLARNADGTVDLGVQLRAIHALATFCPPAPATCGLPHDTLIEVIHAASTPAQTPSDVLRLRTAIEAIGATRSGLDSDVDELLPLLVNTSRDVRATVARALPNLCNPQATGPLMVAYHREAVPQVQLEILSALDALDGPCAK